MSQVTTGIRSLLSIPGIYDFVQNLMGADTGRGILVRDHIRATDGDRLLDIGCGTARILDYLPRVEYHGFDQSKEYIEAACRRYGDRGVFTCAMAEQTIIDHLEPFDVVLATGVLHHLDDAGATGLARLAHSALRKGGRLVTIDPCYTEDQTFISRFLVSSDRGQNVRDPDGYVAITKSVFDDVNATVRHRAWVPYTHCIMECIK